MKLALQLLAFASLAWCMGVAVQRFLGHVPDDVYKQRFLWATIGWFVCQIAAFAVAGKHRRA